MKVVIDLHGEAAEKYMEDKLSETMRRLIIGNEFACERETAEAIKRAFERSHIVSEKCDDDETLKAHEGLLRGNRIWK